MDFKIKAYKCLKIKNDFKTLKLLFFFHGISLNYKNWIKIEQTIKNNQLQCFTVFNTLMVNHLKISIFKKLINLIHGPIILLQSKNKNLNIKQLKNVSLLINLLCLKINNKVYSHHQIKNIQNFSYIKTILTLHKSMASCLKRPYVFLNIYNINFFSK